MCDIENHMVDGEAAAWEEYEGGYSGFEMDEDEACDEMRQREIDNQETIAPAAAPFKAGDRVEYLGNFPQGFTGYDGKPIIHLCRGQRGTVTNIMEGVTYNGAFNNELSIIHSASCIKMDRDKPGTHTVLVDVDGMHDWKIIKDED